MQSGISSYFIWVKKKMLKLLYRFCILNHCLYPLFFDVAVIKLSNFIANFPKMLSDFFTKLFLWCSYQSFLQNIQLYFKNYPTLLFLDTPLIRQAPESKKFLPPVRCLNACVANGGAAVQHPSPAHIDPHMAHRVAAGIGAAEEHQVAGPRFLPRHDGALVIDSHGRSPEQGIGSGMGVDPADEPGAVKGCLRR